MKYITLIFLFAFQSFASEYVSSGAEYEDYQKQAIETFQESIIEFPNQLRSQGCTIKIDFSNSSRFHIQGLGNTQFCRDINSKFAHLSFIFMKEPSAHFCDFTFDYGDDQITNIKYLIQG